MIYKIWMVLSDAEGNPEVGIELPNVIEFGVEKNQIDVSVMMEAFARFIPGDEITFTFTNKGPWTPYTPPVNEDGEWTEQAQRAIASAARELEQ